MENENMNTENKPCEDEKIELPKEIQKRMMDFFLQTSIPRKKAMKINSLSEKERQEN